MAAQKRNKLAGNEWLVKNQEDMFTCPHQPGQLMISKSSCIKRYLASRKEDLGSILKKDFFHYSYIRGLCVCRDCPIGRKLAVARPAARFRPSPRP